MRIGETEYNKINPLIVAEIAQAHDGSEGMAHAMIDASIDAGADAVKFQTHIASEESSAEDQFRVEFSPSDRTRYDYWNRIEFDQEQWGRIAAHCKDRNVHFISSPFSVKAVELLAKIGVEAWKLASGEIQSDWLINSIPSDNTPILASCGLIENSDESLPSIINSFNRPPEQIALLTCVSKYPSGLEEIDLNPIIQWESKYGVNTGISDHSGRIEPSMIALARGASCIEVHVVFDKKQFGPDSSSSLTFSELASVCEFKSAIVKIDSSSILDKEHVINMNRLFGRSIGAKHDLKTGDTITMSTIIPLKPNTGIPWEEHESIIGSTVVTDINRGSLITCDQINQKELCK